MTDIKPDLVVTDLPDASPSDPLEALSWLGETVEEVAEGLRARGIKGKRGDPRSCPLHNYLAEFGWDFAVAGGILNISPDPDKWAPIKMPYPFAEFVGGFDNGNIPDLIADNG